MLWLPDKDSLKIALIICIMPTCGYCTNASNFLWEWKCIFASRCHIPKTAACSIIHSEFLEMYLQQSIHRLTAPAPFWLFTRHKLWWAELDIRLSKEMYYTAVVFNVPTFREPLLCWFVSRGTLVCYRLFWACSRQACYLFFPCFFTAKMQRRNVLTAKGNLKT